MFEIKVNGTTFIFSSEERVAEILYDYCLSSYDEEDSDDRSGED